MLLVFLASFRIQAIVDHWKVKQFDPSDFNTNANDAGNDDFEVVIGNPDGSMHQV